jgi:hypothetical protein
MRSINIPSEDSLAFQDLKEGNSAQVRVVIYGDEQKELGKGKVVTVVHNESELNGKIVSEPLVIDDKREDGGTTVSLIVEKVAG